eukprot:TRINITY_DN16795_c0_g1_i1.p1 TRINITY_DN16795_c0_g1~~TRINITY_DN16795_c0_g1_i1.p1  ORF type:complete len:103 (-),score=3.87 TRINITY_DN16795_c0_g1_i1:10-318(-)
MNSAGCTSYGILDADQDNCLLVFTTPNSGRSEHIMDALSSVCVGKQMGVISATPLEWRNAANDMDVERRSDGRTGFYATVKSHKIIEVVSERIIHSAEFTFD